MKTPVNTSAFPHSEPTQDGQIACWHGMTLRDYFAAKALASLAVEYVKGGPLSITETAEEAYAFADAMLEARAK